MRSTRPRQGLIPSRTLQRADAQLDLEKQGEAGLKLTRQLLAERKLGPRGRMHAIWLIAHNDGAKAIDELLTMAKLDPEVGVRVQAVRAIADLTDPVLVKHKLEAGPGDATIATKLAAIAEGADAALQREVVIALGRLQWKDAPDWIAKHIKKPDAALAHAAMQALRRAGNWPSVLKLLDRPTDDVRSIALRAIADQHEPTVVDGLIERLQNEKDIVTPTVLRRCADPRSPQAGTMGVLGLPPRPATGEHRRLGPHGRHRRGARPLARRPRARRSSRRAQADAAGESAGSHRDAQEVVERGTGRGSGGRTGGALRDVPATESQSALFTVIGLKEYSSANRLRALAILTAGFDKTGTDQLLPLARSLEDGPVLAEVLRLIGRHPTPGGAAALLVSHAASKVTEVRAAAVDSLGELKAREGKEPVLKLLDDREPEVRRAAATAAGKLALKAAADPLLKLAKDSDAGVRVASLDSLRRLKEPRAVPFAVVALEDRATQLAGLNLLGELGGPEDATAVTKLARRAPPSDVLVAAVRTLDSWAGNPSTSAEKRHELERGVAEIHGATGTLSRWTVSGALTEKDTAAIVERLSSVPATDATPPEGWRSTLANAADSRVTFTPAKSPSGTVRLGYTDVVVPAATPIEFTVSSAGALEVWLNGKSVYRSAKSDDSRPGATRFASELTKGNNRLLVQVGASGAAAEFALSFRRKSSSVAHEKLTQAALTRTGDFERGRKVFLDAEKSLCIKCHRVGEQGERIGPELTGIGARFGRVYLIESILDPNRSVVTGFATLRIETKDGRVFTGVKAAETDTTITLADSEAKKYELKKADILEQRPLSVSTMPEGAEKRLTEQEFVDLIAYLVSLKERGPK